MILKDGIQISESFLHSVPHLGFNAFKTAKCHF